MSQPATLTLPCPAKLNLFLHICGRRSDGYHELQTLFQLLDWGDSLQLTRLEEPVIRLLTPLPGVDDQSHLAVRAASLLQQVTSSPFGASIALDKQIPMGGGLGGGSSNAASVLLGLNQLWNTQLSLDELAELGLQLGADVPVFVRGENSFAEGVGERLSPATLPTAWYLLLKPPAEVETATIFGHPELTRDTLPIRIPAFFEAGSQNVSQDTDWPVDLDQLGNDCEPIARKLYPPVADALDWLQAQPEAELTRLTGTGACVFARFSQRSQADAVLDRVPPGWRAVVCQSSQRSSAHLALAELAGRHQ